MTTKLQQAVAAIKGGDRAAGRQLLTEIIQAEPRNELAWLWLANAVESAAQRRQCLQNVLKINPHNEQAKQGLAVLEQRTPHFSGGDIAESVPDPTPGPPAEDEAPAAARPKKLRRLTTHETSAESASPAETPAPIALDSPLPEEEDAPAMSSAAALQKIASDRARGITPNLNEANLSGADLGGADLSEASLHHVNFSGANLTGANLRHSNLTGANLSRANCRQAKLNETQLNGVNLTRADLREANLNGSHLRYADLSGAQLHGANLGWADLTEAVLEGVSYDEHTRWPDGFVAPENAEQQVLSYETLVSGEDEKQQNSSIEVVSPADSEFADETQAEVTAQGQAITKSTGILARFLNEEQDPEVVKKVYEDVSQILTSEEEILYIAAQRKMLLNVTPTSVILTTRRLIMYTPKLLGGSHFVDYIWRDLRDAHFREGVRGATFKMSIISQQRTFVVDQLPKKQARRLYTIAQEIEEYVKEERRRRELEEKSASAGGIYLHQPTAQAPTESFNVSSGSEYETKGQLIEARPSKEQLQSEGSAIGQQFLADDQDPEIVRQAYERSLELLTSNEVILYIAVQNKPLINVTPKSVVLTNRRFIVFSPKLLGGMTFEDYIWRDLKDAHIFEGMMGTKLGLKTVKGRVLIVDYLPKKQARKIYAIAQEMEEKVAEDRRKRNIEEKRAAAGGIYLSGAPMTQQTAAASSVDAADDDPVKKLQQLKKMLDAGLITETEYEAKKADILSRM